MKWIFALNQLVSKVSVNKSLLTVSVIIIWEVSLDAGNKLGRKKWKKKSSNFNNIIAHLRKDEAKWQPVVRKSNIIIPIIKNGSL